MARRKDLLSEAIADAKAVKETALANAKLALEEAFTPKLQSMISAKLAEEADDEMEEELDSSDLGSGDNAEPSADANDSSDIENDDELMVAEDEDEMAEEEEMSEEDEMSEEEDEMSEEEDMDEDDDMEDDSEEMEADEDEDDDDLDLESVIAELEAEMEEDEAPADENYHEEEEVSEEEDEMSEEEDMDEEEEIDLDEVIKTLKEMEEGDYNEEEEANEEEEVEENDELEEAYATIESLQKTINEVNLLNAKLLYTNKLFRTFDLNENQKVKVLENFDRTSSVREVKLVFSTLAENLNVAKKKRTVVKEGYASKATKSSAPKKEIISEGNELSARWKKLAGLK